MFGLGVSPWLYSSLVVYNHGHDSACRGFSHEYISSVCIEVFKRHSSINLNGTIQLKSSKTAIKTSY